MNIFSAIIVSFLLLNVTDALQCFDCEASNPNCTEPFDNRDEFANNCPSSTVACATSRKSSGVERHCSIRCSPGYDVHCCTTNLCNGNGTLPAPRPPLYCHKCGANDSTCGDKRASSQAVLCSDAAVSCYTERQFFGVERGCATSCTEGHPYNLDCCSTSYCNNASADHFTPLAGVLYCYECSGSNCDDPITGKSDMIVSCSSSSKYCYKSISSSSIKRGCATACSSTSSSLKCCSTNFCNDDGYDKASARRFGHFNLATLVGFIVFVRLV